MTKQQHPDDIRRERDLYLEVLKASVRSADFPYIGAPNLEGLRTVRADLIEQARVFANPNE